MNREGEQEKVTDEPAIAQLRVDETRDRYVVLDTDEGAASVCGQWTDATNRVIHMFTRCYVIA